MLTGGSKLCYDLAYFDYVLQHLDKTDLQDAWEKIGDILGPGDRDRVLKRLPRNVCAHSPSDPLLESMLAFVSPLRVRSYVGIFSVQGVCII